MASSKRVACPCCGRMLVPLRDGNSRNHYRSRWQRGHHIDRSYCPNSGFRLRAWWIGQRLRHHGGSVWEVIEQAPGRYKIRCVVGQRAFDGDRWLEAPGREMKVWAEYLHRDGWRSEGTVL